MSRYRLTVLVLALAAVLAACGPDSGNVVAKDYQEPYTYFTTVCASYDSKMNCTFYMTQPIDEPECWHLMFKNGEDFGNACVSLDTWKATELGEWYGEAAGR